MDNYIKPISDELVAGSNIEYDDAFQQLQILVQEKEEQQFGDFIVEAEGKNWDKVYTISSELLLEKSKDLLVMSYFTQSGIVKYGLSGLSDGLKIIYENLQSYWKDVFPLLEDEDGDYDPDFRVNALSLFTSHDGIIKQTREAFLIKENLSHSSFNIKAIENLIDNRAGNTDYPGGFDKLSIDLQIAMEQGVKELLAIKNSLFYLEKLNELFEERVDISLKFDKLQQLLSKILNTMATNTVTMTDENTETVNGTVTQSVQPETGQSVNWAHYHINSRKDINLLLEKIYVYFEKNEPSHPAPLFIRRIQKLLNLNFYEIMQDISPESLAKLESLVGEPLENNDDNNNDD